MIQLTVNGLVRQFDGDPDMPLLWYLRDWRQEEVPAPGLAYAAPGTVDEETPAQSAEGSDVERRCHATRTTG
jgi:hypothetical protein